MQQNRIWKKNKTKNDYEEKLEPQNSNQIDERFYFLID